MNLSPAEKNAIDAIDMLLQMSKVSVTRQTLRNKLWQHPDFPSLASLSDTLTEVKVTNLATRLSSDRLSEIPLPAVAYLQIEGGIFAPIRTVSDSTIEWLHTKKGWQRESIARFNQIWEGVTLLIEPNEQSGEANYDKKRKLEIIESLRYPFAWIGLIVCLSLVIVLGFQNYPLNQNKIIYTLLGIKMAGFAVSSLLVWYSIDISNPFLRKICRLNSRTNCHHILNSKAAKLFDWLSWAEVGLFYFAGGLIALLYSTIIPSASVVQYLLLFNYLALPYTIYSIYYQAFVAREWCLLCTCVQILLWAEFIISLELWLPSALNLSLPTIALLSFSFLIIPTLWALAKPLLQKSKQTVQLHKDIYKIKFDSNYVKGLLDKQQILPPYTTVHSGLLGYN